MRHYVSEMNGNDFDRRGALTNTGFVPHEFQVPIPTRHGPQSAISSVLSEGCPPCCRWPALAHLGVVRTHSGDGGSGGTEATRVLTPVPHTWAAEVLERTCSTELKKHVLPRLLSPTTVCRRSTTVSVPSPCCNTTVPISGSRPHQGTKHLGYHATCPLVFEWKRCIVVAKSCGQARGGRSLSDRASPSLRDASQRAAQHPLTEA